MRSVGPYVLGEKLGQRQIHTRHRAEGPSGEVELLLTALPDDLPDSMRSAFDRDARAARGLRHENVLGLVDHGFHEHGAYLVHEPWDGELLETLLGGAGRGLDPELVALIGMDVARALQAAHALEPPLLHRAVAPAEIVIDAEGRCRLTGWAIASFVIAMSGIRSQLLELSCGFQSPESLKNRALGPKTDLFSLGSTLYLALTGRAAFDGGSVLATTLKVSMAKYEPLTGFDPELTDVVHALLSKDPAARPDARAAANLLANCVRRPESLRRSLGAMVRPPPEPAPNARVAIPRVEEELPPGPDPMTTEPSVPLGAVIDDVKTEIAALPAELQPTPTVVSTFTPYAESEDAVTVPRGSRHDAEGELSVPSTVVMVAPGAASAFGRTDDGERPTRPMPATTPLPRREPAPLVPEPRERPVDDAAARERLRYIATYVGIGIGAIVLVLLTALFAMWLAG